MTVDGHRVILFTTWLTAKSFLKMDETQSYRPPGAPWFTLKGHHRSSLLSPTGWAVCNSWIFGAWNLELLHPRRLPGSWEDMLVLAEALCLFLEFSEICGQRQACTGTDCTASQQWENTSQATWRCWTEAPSPDHAFVNIVYFVNIICFELSRKYFFWGKVYEDKISVALIHPKYLGIYIL